MRKFDESKEMIFIFLLLLSRIYHPETIDSMQKSIHTHVQVSGIVTLVKKEADGDIHFRISDTHNHFIVCEIIPSIPLTPPKLKQMVTVSGIRRYDSETNHNWMEIHPVEKWELMK